MTPRFPVILGTGGYTPAHILTNADLCKRVETSEEWIRSRSGIHERRIAAEGESTSDMAVLAARRALESAGTPPSDIDLLVLATITPDQPMPATACLVQHKLGLPSTAACFDIGAACSGFIYAMEVASAMVSSGRYRKALVIGAEKLSTVVDWQDRTTCLLFGDGAGAAVLGAGSGDDRGILGSQLGVHGKDAGLLYIPGGGSSVPASAATVAGRQHFIRMRGREIFKMAVRSMEEAARGILEQHGLTADQIALVIPHQANLRIIEAIAHYLEIPMDRFVVNVDRYGNTSAASIPIALDEASRAGRIKRGDLVLLVAFGAGLTYGSMLIRW